MTPEQRALRDAYLSETWATVREYRDGDPLPKRKVRKPRKPRDARNGPRKPCPVCGVEYGAAYVPDHIIRRHPRMVDNPVDNGESGAA
jgi:hypothetical protein